MSWEEPGKRPPGCSWFLILAPPGSSRLLLALPVTSWLTLAPPGSSWLPGAICTQAASKTKVGECMCSMLLAEDPLADVRCSGANRPLAAR